MVEIIRKMAEMMWQIIQRIMNKESLKGTATMQRIIKVAEKREEDFLRIYKVKLEKVNMKVG